MASSTIPGGVADVSIWVNDPDCQHGWQTKVVGYHICLQSKVGIVLGLAADLPCTNAVMKQGQALPEGPLIELVFL